MYGMSPYIKHILDCLIFLQPFRQTQKTRWQFSASGIFIYLSVTSHRLPCRWRASQTHRTQSLSDRLSHPRSAVPLRYPRSSLSGIWRFQPDRQTDSGPPAKIAARRRWSKRMRRLGPVFRFDRINNGFVRRNLIVVLRLGHQQPFR